MADTPQDRLARYNPMPMTPAARLAACNSPFHPTWQVSDAYALPARKKAASLPGKAKSAPGTSQSFERTYNR